MQLSSRERRAPPLRRQHFKGFIFPRLTMALRHVGTCGNGTRNQPLCKKWDHENRRLEAPFQRTVTRDQRLRVITPQQV